ncbi:MAG: hypothetical protein PHR03_02295 [Desulfovibrionales bacterium]|nr:hypothetical protein [Desulfovibrionales bacterium]
MKSETESWVDDLVQSIGELAMDAQKLARVAVQQYSAEVEAILKAQSRDSRRIERCLDGILDFCFDDGALVLYKKLCRYYFDIDPEATVSYVHAYREMWDKQKPGKGPLDGETRQTGHTTSHDEMGHKGVKDDDNDAT